MLSSGRSPAIGSTIIQVPSSFRMRRIRAAQPLGSPMSCNTIDWTVRENVSAQLRVLVKRVRAQLRVLVKRILRKYGYPPDKQEKATETVLEQAGTFFGILGWVGGSLIRPGARLSCFPGCISALLTSCVRLSRLTP